MAGGDQYARAYARLLSEPCNAPLVHPPYIGGEAGYLTRVEFDGIYFNNTSTDTGGILAFVPGAFTGLNSPDICSFMFSATNSGTGTGQDPDASTTLASSAARQPGFNFLGSNAATVRPVAACVEVSYPGSELNRQGFVSLGNVSAAIVRAANGSGSSIKPSAVRTLVQTTDRTPEGKLVCNWLPRAGDELATEVDLVNADGDVARRGAIMLAASGLQPGVGLRVRYVVVYQWTPDLATNMMAPIDDGPTTRMRVEDIISGLKKINAFTARMSTMGTMLRDIVGRTRALRLEL